MVSVKLVVWLRVDEELPSERPPKLVKDRVGGPQAAGVWSGPTIPSSCATFVLPAKYGVARLMLRLKGRLALLLNRGLKICVQPSVELSPYPLEVSLKPKSCWLVEPLKLNCWLKLSVFLLLTRPFSRTANEL